MLKTKDITLEAEFIKHGLRWFEDHSEESLKLQSRMSVFNDAMTMWLMVAQRGVAKNTLVSTVQQLKYSTKLEQIAILVKKSKRYAQSEISSHAGGFSNARKRLPLEKVEAFSDYACKSADEEHRGISYMHGHRCYIFDGSTIELQNTEKIREEFPPSRNQHKTYQPSARIVVAHNVITGAAFRPAIGPLHKSEQELCVDLMSALPKDAMVIADRNFGIFSVAWNLHKHGLISLVRMKEDRAMRVLGVASIDHDGDHPVTWTPSYADRKTNDFPQEAALKGRVIVITIQPPGQKAERFYFFTTALKLSPAVIAEIYRYRWFVEGDLKSIKTTVDLATIKAKSPDIVRKEIILGILAYTLIRTVIARGAKMMQMLPRQFSFSRARDHIITCAFLISNSKNMKEVHNVLGNFLVGLRQCKLPERTKFRSEPRKIVRRKRSNFSTFKKSRAEEKNEMISKRNSKA